MSWTVRVNCVIRETKRVLQSKISESKTETETKDGQKQPNRTGVEKSWLHEDLSLDKNELSLRGSSVFTSVLTRYKSRRPSRPLLR